MARTVIDVDPALVDRAKELLGVTTMNAAVTEALFRVVRRDARRRVIKMMAELDDEQRALIAEAREIGW